MNSRNVLHLWIGTLALAVSAGAAPIADARTGGNPTATTVTGTVRTIDVKKKNMTITTSVGTSVKLAVGRSTAITRNGSRTTLTGLALNDGVTARYKVSGLVALSVTAAGPAITTTSGRTNGVSLAAGTLSIGTRNLQTNANTRISRNGQIVALQQITLRDSLVAHVAIGTSTALDVLADGPQESEVHGAITAIVGSTVTIAPDDGSPPVDTLVGPDTQIEVNDATGALTDLEVGQAVEAEYDPTTFVAFSIDASSESEDGEIEGTVSGVDTTAGTVTITPKDGGADITVTVDATTEIEVNDDGAALADILVGMPIKAEFDATSLLAKEIKAGGAED